MIFKAIVSYDGTRYFGWQKTRMGPNIQEKIASAILQITGEQVLPEAASRTDRGVHAEGQVIQFNLNKEYEPHRLQRSLNAVLPSDIRIARLEFASADFHPTLDALAKEYHYRISLGPVQEPIDRLYAWHFHSPLDLEKMKIAANDLIGTHDFTALSNERSNEKEKDPLCKLMQIEIDCMDQGHLQLKITGNRFLYKMARNIAGILVYIGCGKLSQDCILSIIASRDRKKAGVTAPAHGLFLHKVFY